MRNRTLALGLLALASLLLPSRPALAQAFSAPAQVDSLELSGGATFFDDFDNGVFPEAPWVQLCGSGSESGGALSVDSAGPGALCGGGTLFLGGPNVGFTTNTVLSGVFKAVLPADGEAVGIQVGTAAGDFFNFGVFGEAGDILLGINDENGFQGSVLVDPGDLPVSSYDLQISLVEDSSGILVPTVAARSDGNPFFATTLPAALGLDTNLLGPSGFYVGGVVAAFVPEPSTPALLLLAGVLLARRRGRRA